MKIEEDIDTKIDKVLDRFLNSDHLERTRFVKAFDEKNKTQILAIAHTKLDQFDKTWSNLRFPKNLPTGFTKPFTRPDATSTTKMIGATCKIFPLKSMNPRLQQRIRDLFPGLRTVEEYEQHEDEDDIPASQDFPGLQQSEGPGTLKSCMLCIYQTRQENDLNSHMLLHPKCTQCSKSFANDKTLKIHMSKVHETFRYEILFNKGWLRLRTAPRVTHANCLDQYEYCLIQTIILDVTFALRMCQQVSKLNTSRNTRQKRTLRKDLRRVECPGIRDQKQKSKL